VGNANPTFRHFIEIVELQNVQKQQAANRERRLKEKRKEEKEGLKFKREITTLVHATEGLQ
jgi:predicted GIY-YIG superfamily endonuclease